MQVSLDQGGFRGILNVKVIANGAKVLLPLKPL
jgi:hypothetical protein